ncbi:infB, partial [Acrasis kona]
MKEEMDQSKKTLDRVDRIERAVEAVEKLIVQQNVNSLRVCLHQYRDLIPTELHERSSTFLVNLVHRQSVDSEKFISEWTLLKNLKIESEKTSLSQLQTRVEQYNKSKTDRRKSNRNGSHHLILNMDDDDDDED